MDTIDQMDDLIKLSAFQVVHGVEAGYRRFRYLRFGTPESDPLPEGVDLDCRRIPPWR